MNGIFDLKKAQKLTKKNVEPPSSPTTVESRTDITYSMIARRKLRNNIELGNKIVFVEKKKKKKQPNNNN